MALKPGTRLGTFELIGQIGAGGMGEVYKARDLKLNRLVAIKVLPAALAADEGLVARFGREAKAVAALSHPNVLGIFDLATQDGLTYAVMELLEGESLRDRLRGGALSPRRAVEIAIEVAQGLGAAHERGIVHRDVKPENIFITREGRVKVLDFGLAKLTAPRADPEQLDTEGITRTSFDTQAGQVLGTIGYMSPEQVKGEPVDHRSDIFAFGVLLFEMLGGQRPFQGRTAHHTLTAILDQEPPALVASRGPLPPALERLVAHCLEKHPGARFQSMQDLVYDLQNLGAAAADPAPRPRPAWRPALGAAVALLPLALAGLAWSLRLPPFRPPSPPSFTRLTFTPGTVEAACFGPDGRTVYFSQRLQGGPPQLFVLHPDNPEPSPLGQPDALLEGVSKGNDVAFLLRAKPFLGSSYRGMLAQTNGGGPAREILGEVVSAAWDGQGFALLTSDEHATISLEFPAGRILVRAEAPSRTLRYLRLSRDGQRLALLDADTVTKTEIVTYDRAGRRTSLFTKVGDNNGDTLTGLAWGPGGELWFSEINGDQTNLWTLAMNGRRRLLWRGDGTKALMDVAPDGRILLADQQVRRGVLVQRAGASRTQDLSVAGSTQAVGMADDGKALLLMESPILDGGTRLDRCYLNRLDGTPALRLARGTPNALSANGRWYQVAFTGLTPEELDPDFRAAFQRAGLDPRAALDPNNPAPYLLFAPTGPERPFAIALRPPLEGAGLAYLHPDGRRVVFQAEEHGQFYWYVSDHQGGDLHRLTPPGYGLNTAGLQPLSPDGSLLIVSAGLDRFSVQPVAGGAPVPIRGLQDRERPVGWSQAPHSIYVRTGNDAIRVTLTRLDLGTGARQELFRFLPGDASGLLLVRSVFMPMDARLFALTYVRQLSQLYQVEGVR